MYPLQGVKVLDLSRVLAGPWCTQTLADLGAQVWKIEEPTRGDDTRSWSPPDIGGESTYFLCCNRSKKSVAVDLRSEEGQATIRRLAERADVLVENFRMGALDRFGLSYDRLSKDNPRLIYCSISGYGRTGARAEEPGYDFVIQAESGLMAITGKPDDEPIKHGVAITDLVTGMSATQAILAALIAREKTGKGQFLDMALFDSAVALLANQASGYLATGADPARYGNAHATVVPYQIFETVDGVLALAVGNDSQFRILCAKVLHRSELADDPRYITNRERVLNRDSLVPLLADAFRERSTRDWIAALKREGVPAGQVRTVAQVFAAPEVAERGLVVEVPDPVHGRLRIPASPLRFSDTPTRPPTAPPRLGEHTREVLDRELGVSPQEAKGNQMARSGNEPHDFDPAASGWSVHSEAGLIDLVGPLWHRRDGVGMRLGFMARSEHVNRRGIVHGGMLLTLADQTLGMTAFEATGRQPQATIQLDVQFVAAVAVGDFVEAEAQVVRRTRSLIFVKGTFRVSDTTVATASGIWKIIGH